MVSPMQKVSSLVSKDIGNYLSNRASWSIVYILSQYGVGDGTTDDYAAINSLLTTIGSTEATIAVTVDFRLGSSITFPANVTLWFLQGGVLKPDSGKTVTINGPIEAGLYQIFSGVIVGAPKVGCVYPQWWGASGSANTYTGTIASGSRTLTLTTSSHDFVQGQGISIPGAGAAGATLVTTVSGVSGAVVTVADAASTAATGVTVRHDDTVSVRTAITNAAVTGAKVIVPPGDYYFSSNPIPADTNVFIEGSNGTGSSGRGTKFHTTSLTDDVLRIEAVAQSIQGIIIRDIMIVGNKSAGSSGSGIKMVANTSGKTISAIIMDNVQINDCKEHGLYMTATSFIFEGTFTNLRTSGNGNRGVFGENNVQQLTFIDNQNLSAGQENLAIVGDATNGYRPSEIVFDRLVLDTAGSTYYGARFTYCEKISLYDVHTESQPTGQILLESCSYVDIKNGGIRQTGTAKGVVISNLAGKDTKFIKVDVPGWTSTSSQKRIEVLLPSSSNFHDFEFGFHADGVFTPTDITGYTTLFMNPANSIFFVKNPSYTTTYDPPSIAAGGSAFKSLTVDRAVLGNIVTASFDKDTQGIIIVPYVQSTGVVNVAFFNPTSGAIDLASGTLTVRLNLR